MIEKDLIEIYKENMFLLKDSEQELWFSLNSPLDKSYYSRGFAILTACNPNNKPTNDIENSIANERLKTDVSNYDVLGSIGKYKDHQEDSFLIYGISLKDALVLGIKYNQYSIFYNNTKELSYIECSTEKVLVSIKI